MFAGFVYCVYNVYVCWIVWNERKRKKALHLMHSDNGGGFDDATAAEMSRQS